MDAAASGRAIRVGAAYNVFDGIELLEASIRSIRPIVSFVCVVYQSESNFGAKAAPASAKALQDLVRRGIVDELVHYSPQTFTNAEKVHLAAPNATPADMGGARPEDIGDQFCNELCKRELGRRRCLARGCDAFMSVDADEFYARGQLAQAISRMWSGDYDLVTCQMRLFVSHPCWELRPRDTMNRVVAVMRCHPRMPFRLCVPTTLVIDPTRRLHRARKLLDLPPSELEMHHMTLVRTDIESKLRNVSNRSNYSADVRAQAKRLTTFRPDRHPVEHPHRSLARTFRSVLVVPDYFGVRLPGMARQPELPVGSMYTDGREDGPGAAAAADARVPAAAFELPPGWPPLVDDTVRDSAPPAAASASSAAAGLVSETARA